MSSKYEKFQKRRLISSYFSVVLSITLVLFLLGMLGLIVLNSKQVGDYFKEQIPFSVYLKDDAKEADVTQLRQGLAMADYVKSATYVSKQQAAEAHAQAIGEDFMDYLGYNPLQNSIDVYLNADYVTADTFEEITNELFDKPFVEEVEYDKPLVEKLESNVKRISLWMLVITGIFLVIAVLLINSSIRLSVYAKRFTIKTMQMVGATKAFIRRPFIWQNIKLGLLSAILAMGGMLGVLYYLQKSFAELNLLDDKLLLGGLFAGVLVFGFLISWASTYFATQRFLNLRIDELYN